MNKNQNLFRRTKTRLYELDLIKGFAILLVVIGHIADPGQSPLIIGSELYFKLKYLIYSFHMPLFMAVSGMIFFYTFKSFKNSNDYLVYVLKKVERLLLPFFIMGVIIIIGKVVVGRFIHINNFTDSTSFLDSVLTLFLRPMESSSRSLWFLYVLFEYYLVFPLLILLFFNRLYVLVILGLVLYILHPTNNFLALNQFFTYFLFFALGINIMKYYDLYKIFIKKYGVFFIVLFIISFYFRDYFQLNEALLYFGILAIISIHYIALYSSYLNNSFFQTLGKYTMVIYLLNLIVMSIFTGILVKLLPLTDNVFNFFFPLIVFIGIFMPIMIKKYIFSRSKFLSKLTD